MPVEQLTYSSLAERLGITPEAARAVARRHHLPRLRGNDGKALIAVDLQEIQHKPMPPARSARGHRPVSDTVATLTAKVEALEAELVAEQQRAADHRADYEHERARADDMVVIQGRLIAELEALRRLLQATPHTAQPVTTRTWRAWRWIAQAANNR